MTLGLIEVERINAITLKRMALLDELREREAMPPHPRVGAWRHAYNLEALRSKIALLERQRMLYVQKRVNARSGL